MRSTRKVQLETVKQYKKRIGQQNAFDDQFKKSSHGQGFVKEKYWFSPEGKIIPVEREHGDQMLTLARELKLIPPDKAISDYGYRSKWQLAMGMFFSKKWLRVQVYEAQTIGLNAVPAALIRKTTEKAVAIIMSQPRTYFFQENWPYTLEYKTTAQDYKKFGWKKMIERARQSALSAKKEATNPWKK